MSDDIVLRLLAEGEYESVGDGTKQWEPNQICNEAAWEIYELRRQLHQARRNTPSTLTATRCGICKYPYSPRLINVTNMGDEQPRWVIDWYCDNGGLHDYILEHQDQQQ